MYRNEVDAGEMTFSAFCQVYYNSTQHANLMSTLPNFFANRLGDLRRICCSTKISR